MSRCIAVALSFACVMLLVALIAAGASGGEIAIAPLTFLSEGEPVEAILYKPRESAGKRPALVLSPARLRNIKGLEWLSRSLAERGYVVLAQRYREGDVRYQLRDVDDIRHAISYLESFTDVDAGRLGIIGHSRGASASLRAAAKDLRVRSTVALSPPTDHARYMRGVREYAPSRYAVMLKAYGGSPEETPDYYHAISAVNYAAQIKTPVLLVHGTGDLLAPHDHSQWMYDALVKAGNPRVKIELLPGLGHWFEDGYGGYRFERVSELVSQWFAETLQ